jgi:hypothetical protein
MAADTRWRISGDYFENCNCDVVCPCLFSPAPPLTSQPTQGACEVGFGFHVTHGNFGDVALDGFNVAVLARTPGPMAEGNWTVALYVDESADEAQRAALTAIFSGAAGGTMGNLAPLISTVLGVVPVPIHWTAEAQHRSIEIPGRMAMGVVAAPSMVPGEEIWARNAHPFASEIAMAVGTDASTWTDFGMRWDNSGKNGHYAPIEWTNA